MPPGRRGKRGGPPAVPSTFGGDRLLGKRSEPDSGAPQLDLEPKPQRRHYENQSSFATFMQKKGDIIN